MQRMYYSIKEVSKMLDVPFSTLRYWEQVIPQLRVHRNEGKSRFYTEENIQTAKRIKYLREEEKLPIEAVIRKLNQEPDSVERRTKLAEQLQRLRAELVELRSLL